MYEGTRRIILQQPGALVEQPDGQQVAGLPIEHVTYASIVDRGGTLGVVDDAVTGNWSTRFMISSDGFTNVNHNWKVVDDLNRVFTITAVAEVPNTHGFRAGGYIYIFGVRLT